MYEIRTRKRFGMAKIKTNEDSLPNEMKKLKKVGIAIHYILNSVKNSNDFPTTKSRARYFLVEKKRRNNNLSRAYFFIHFFSFNYFLLHSNKSQSGA